MHGRLAALHPIHGMLLPGGVVGGHVDGGHGCGRVLLQLPRHHAVPERARRPGRRALPLAYVAPWPGQGWDEGHALASHRMLQPRVGYMIRTARAQLDIILTISGHRGSGGGLPMKMQWRLSNCTISLQLHTTES